MAYKITWTKKANNTLFKLVDFLAEHWSDRVVSEFVDKVYESVERLADFPELGQPIAIGKGVRGLLIYPYTRLYYRIKGQNVILLKFVDVRQK